MWEKQHQTAEMGTEGRAGTTLRVCSEKSHKEVVAVLDYNLNRLSLSMRSGEYVYVSEWLALSPHCPAEHTAPDIRQGLERWLLLVSQPYTRQTSDWPPLELITLLLRQIDAYLA